MMIALKLKIVFFVFELKRKEVNKIEDLDMSVEKLKEDFDKEKLKNAEI